MEATTVANFFMAAPQIHARIITPLARELLPLQHSEFEFFTPTEVQRGDMSALGQQRNFPEDTRTRRHHG
jgi:hypothetical protein